jgi:hypothetical protein
MTVAMLVVGLLASRSRRLATIVLLVYGVLIAVASIAIYVTESAAQSAPDFEPHEDPFTPDGWVILVNIIYFVPWAISFLVGWGIGAWARGRGDVAGPTSAATVVQV